MLRVENLSFAYNSDDVLRDVSFEVRSGEMMFILGPNGSGKTTLLKCLARILKPRGCVLIEGVNAAKLDELEIAKIIGYVPQSGEGGYLTVFDAIILGRKPYMGWKPSEEDVRVVEDVITLLGLEDIAFRRLNEISGGELQKVMIARALAQKPKVLLLDEPTNHLDVKNKIEIMNVLRRLANQGYAIVVVTHDLSFASLYADRIVLMKDGKIIAQGGKDVLTDEVVKRVYGIEVEVLRMDGRVLILPKVPA